MGLTRKNPDLDLQADMDRPWPLADGQFSVVYASHVLEHARDPMHWVREAFRVLRSGGVLRVSVPNAQVYCRNYLRGAIPLYDAIRSLRSWGGAPPLIAHWHPFDADTLVRLLSRGWYPLLGELGKEDEVAEPLFSDVKILKPGESRVEELRHGYFSTRPDRSVFCEGVKP